MINVKTKDGGSVKLSHLDIEDLYQREAATVAARFRWLRVMNGMEPGRFASLLQIGAGALNAIERGERMASDAEILKACRATGAQLEWLSDGDGEPFMNAEPPKAAASGSLTEALTWEACLQQESGTPTLQTGSWNPTGLSLDEEVTEKDAMFETQLARLEDQKQATDIQESVCELKYMAEYRGFERGMKYGARLVFQLLTGTDSTGLETLIQDAVQRLAGIERTLQAGGIL